MAFRAVMVSIAVVVLGVALGRALRLIPVPLRLPPFSERVVLKVEAQWRSDKCMDVVTITNLPRGTHFRIAVRPQFEPGGDSPRDQLASSTMSDGFDVESTQPHMRHRKVFCEPNRWSRHRVFAVIVRIHVAQLSGRSLINERQGKHQETLREKKQRQAIGKHGELLRGPLARKRTWLPGSNPDTIAESKPFVLPLPRGRE